MIHPHRVFKILQCEVFEGDENSHTMQFLEFHSCPANGSEYIFLVDRKYPPKFDVDFMSKIHLELLRIQ